MATTELTNFLLSVAAAIAAATTPALSIEDEGDGGVQLWIHDAVEDRSSAVYTVLRIYRGSEPPVFAGMRVNKVSVQADTRGADAAAVLQQAQAVHEALIDDQGRARFAWTIDGKKFDDDEAVVDDEDGDWEVRFVRFVTAPGLVNRDDKGRWTATGNFDLDFARAA